MNNPDKLTKIVVGIVVVGLIAAGVVWAVLHFNQTSTPGTTNQPSSSSNNEQAVATITYDGSSFSPSSVTVKSGDKVRVVNNSQDMLQFESNPHPVHTDDPDLNVGSVDPGQSQTFTVSQKGTFGYHNHLNPSQGGNITIQ